MIVRLNSLLISLSKFRKLALSFWWGIIFGMIFYSELPVGLFYLLFSSIFGYLKNLVGIGLFLDFLRKVFFEKIFFLFWYTVFIKEPVKNLMRILWLVSGHNSQPLYLCQRSELYANRSVESTGEEERIVHVKEMS